MATYSVSAATSVKVSPPTTVPPPVMASEVATFKESSSNSFTMSQPGAAKEIDHLIAVSGSTQITISSSPSWDHTTNAYKNCFVSFGKDATGMANGSLRQIQRITLSVDGSCTVKAAILKSGSNAVAISDGKTMQKISIYSKSGSSNVTLTNNNTFDKYKTNLGLLVLTITDSNFVNKRVSLNVAQTLTVASGGYAV